MIFKIYDCDFGIKISGTTYNFEHVVELQIEDQERNKLTRGSNAGNKVGLAYREGIRSPKRWTIPIMNLSAELKVVLDAAYEAQTRMEVFAINRLDGSNKMARNAVLSNKPQQLTLDENPDSMAVSIEWETFDSEEVHRS